MMLQGAWNFRDVSNGIAELRPGRLFRSSELSAIDEAGWAQLLRTGVADIADLRSPKEIERGPLNGVPSEITVHHLPFPATAVTADAPHEQSFQRVMQEAHDEPTAQRLSRAFMVEEYQRFSTLPGAQRAVRKVIYLLGQGRSVLVSCFAGKDRTGFLIATVLRSAGVSDSKIMQDFLRSNDATGKLREHLRGALEARREAYPELSASNAWLSEDLLGVRSDYLEASSRGIEAAFGSLSGYLVAAQVSESDLVRLRAALLV